MRKLYIFYKKFLFDSEENFFIGCWHHIFKNISVLIGSFIATLTQKYIWLIVKNHYTIQTQNWTSWHWRIAKWFLFLLLSPGCFGLTFHSVLYCFVASVRALHRLELLLESGPSWTQPHVEHHWSPWAPL